MGHGVGAGVRRSGSMRESRTMAAAAGLAADEESLGGGGDLRRSGSVKVGGMGGHSSSRRVTAASGGKLDAWWSNETGRQTGDEQLTIVVPERKVDEKQARKERIRKALEDELLLSDDPQDGPDEPPTHHLSHLNIDIRPPSSSSHSNDIPSSPTSSILSTLSSAPTFTLSRFQPPHLNLNDFSGIPNSPSTRDLNRTITPPLPPLPGPPMFFPSSLVPARGTEGEKRAVQRVPDDARRLLRRMLDPKAERRGTMKDVREWAEGRGWRADGARTEAGEGGGKEVEEEGGHRS
jgi:hypothetical protein